MPVAVIASNGIVCGIHDSLKSLKEVGYLAPAHRPAGARLPSRSHRNAPQLRHLPRWEALFGDACQDLETDHEVVFY